MGIRMQYTLSGRLCNKSLKEFSDMKDSSFTPGGFAMDVPIHGKTVYVPFDWCSYSASVNEERKQSFLSAQKTNSMIVTRKIGQHLESAGVI